MVFLNKAMAYYIEAWQKCVVFKGRTSREAFWCFQLINFLAVLAVLSILNIFSNPNNIVFDSYHMNIYLSYPTILFFPQISMSIRRLHDVGKSGWMALLFYVPLVNIWLLVLLITKGDTGHNKYGKNPEEIERASDGDIASL